MMTTTDLKQYIYENKKIPEILKALGCGHIEYHSQKGYYSASNKDGDNISAINLYDNPYCDYINWTRGVSSSDHKDIISLVQYALGLDFVDALKWIHKTLGIPYTFYNKKPIVKKKDPLEVFKKYIRKNRFDVANVQPIDLTTMEDCVPTVHIDIFRQGIVKKTIRKFGLFYSYRMKRTCYPIYYIDGSVMGFTGRTSIENYDVFGISKYYISKGLNKSITIYGYYQNKKDIEKAGYCTIFEAEKSVCLRDSRGDSTGLALEGHVISEEQIRILMSLNINEIVIALDKDISLREVWGICDRLYLMRNVSYIYDVHNILEPKQSPADVDMKKYKYLFDHRFKYGEKEHKALVEGKVG